MIAEQTPQGTLRAKTGACQPAGRPRGHAVVRRLRREAGRRLVLRARARRQGLRPPVPDPRQQGARDPRRPRHPAGTRRLANDRRSARQPWLTSAADWKTVVEACALGPQPRCAAPPVQPAAGVLRPEHRRRRRVPAEVAQLPHPRRAALPAGQRRVQLALPRDGRRGIAQGLLPRLRDARARHRLARRDRRRGRRRLSAEPRQPRLPGSVTG